MRQHSLRRMVLTGAAAGCLYAFCSATPITLQAHEPTIEPAPADLQRWVRELDDESYPVREAATRRLVQAGSAAIEPLAGAVLSDSAEVSFRASDALARIASQGDEAALDNISSSLRKLSSSRPALVKLAREVNSRQQNFKHTQAIAKIRGLGGNISGHWQSELERGEPVSEAIGLVDVAVAPAIAFEEVAAPDIRLVEPAVEARPAPRGVFGLLARLVVPELAPVPVAPLELPVEAGPIAPAAEPEIQRIDVPEPPVAPAIEAGRLEAPAVAPAAPADLPALDPRAEDTPPPAPVVEAIEVVPDPPVADGVEIAAVDVGFIGPAVIVGDGFGGEGEDYAELTLDKSFRGTDADLAVLKNIPELYNLKIDGAKLSDKSLEHVAALPRLTTLELSGTEMSSVALRKLRAKRPELSVICRSSAMLGINSGLEGPCVLTSVFYRSGAYEAGLRDGDEITEVDGQKVRDFSDLTIAVYPHKAGDKLKVKYNRAGKPHEAVVTLKPRNVVETSE